MVTETIKLRLSKGTDVLLRVAAVIAALTAIGGGYVFYQTYLYRPTVTVQSADFTNGTATLQVGSLQILLVGDATYSINGQWGVRFGSKIVNGKNVYDRIELVRQGMVYEYLEAPNATAAATTQTTQTTT